MKAFQLSVITLMVSALGQPNGDNTVESPSAQPTTSPTSSTALSSNSIQSDVAIYGNSQTQVWLVQDLLASRLRRAFIEYVDNLQQNIDPSSNAHWTEAIDYQLWRNRLQGEVPRPTPSPFKIGFWGGVWGSVAIFWLKPFGDVLVLKISGSG